MQKAIQWNHALAVEISIYNNKRTPQALIVSNSDPTSTGKQKRANDIEMELEKQNAISDKWVDDSILELPQAKQKKKKEDEWNPQNCPFHQYVDHAKKIVAFPSKDVSQKNIIKDGILHRSNARLA